MRRLADRAGAVLAILGPLGAGSRVLLLRVLGRFGWKIVAGGGLLAMYAAVRYRTWIAWMLVAWCLAAWMHAPEADGPDEETAPEPRLALARWLLDTIGDRPGIHLRDLYPAMRQLPGQEGRTDAELRAALRTLGVPVQRSLRIGPIAGRSGVRREDVEALLRRLGEWRVDFDGDAGQGTDSPRFSANGEGVEST
ncbi:hypothetical protein ACWGQ5_47180 [Streptomyces sp. NPDC055722]